VPKAAYNDPTAHRKIKIHNKSDVPAIVFNSGDTFTVSTLKANAGLDIKGAVNAGVEGGQLSKESKEYKTKIPPRSLKSVQFHGNQTHNYFTYGYIVDGEYKFLEINKYLPHNSEITLKLYDELEVVDQMPDPQAAGGASPASPEKAQAAPEKVESAAEKVESAAADNTDA